ncbi:MAG TPA: hypothetical protein VFV73_27515 [Streptosporangiaceae bacterium]|nr:hypothetical protein [Streptosporangiaceae bacterium]
MTTSVSPGQSQKTPSAERSASSARTSAAKSSRRSPNSARCGAVPWPARRVDPRYFRTSALISSCGIAGTPGPGGRGRPVTVWTISASAPPGSSMS